MPYTCALRERENKIDYHLRLDQGGGAGDGEGGGAV